jgi:hypothetical protein
MRAADLRYAATIHHGVPMEDFPFDTDGSEDLLFFGRIHPDKGMAEAIAAAHRSGRKLIMAGIVQDQNLAMRRQRPPSTIGLWSTRAQPAARRARCSPTCWLSPANRKCPSAAKLTLMIRSGRATASLFIQNGLDDESLSPNAMCGPVFALGASA